MSTGKTFTNFVFKRLLGTDDFSTRFLDFLLDSFREVVVRVFDADGIFDAKITFAGTASDVITLAQTSPGDFRGTDGVGNIIGLGESGSEDAGAGQIKVISIENITATTYHLSLEYTNRPKGIQINPRSGRPEYTEIIETVGKKATPNFVTDNGSDLTFMIDSVCEGGHSHAGRTAIVYLNTPARGAITEAIAIESCVVSWNGVNNRITTSALLGQNSPSTTIGDYSIVLLGPSVRKVDTSAVAGHTYLGTIVGVGVGSTPGTGDNSNQNLIDSSLSTLLLYSGGPNWADGVTNPTASITDQLTKIINDLTSTSGFRGLGKITSPALGDWHDGTTNPANRADTVLAKVVSDLAAETGNSGADKIGAKALPKAWADSSIIGPMSVHDQLNNIISSLTVLAGTRGLGKITAATRAAWADTTANPATDAATALAKIISDLVSTTGQRGAGKITAPARSNWYDSTTNVAARLDEAIDKIITDLTEESDDGGGAKISCVIDTQFHDGTTWTGYSSIKSLLGSIVERLADSAGSDRIGSTNLSSAAIIPVPAGIISLPATDVSIKDQIQELLQLQAAPIQLAAYAARNYNVRETMLTTGMIIRDFIPQRLLPSPYRWYAIGDNGVGTVSDIRTTSGHVGVAWTTGPTWNGSPTILQEISHDSAANYVIIIGDDASGAWMEYCAENLGSAMIGCTFNNATDLNGHAVLYAPQASRCFAGFYQKVIGTGAPIQYSSAPNVAFSNCTVPGTLRGIYTFAEDEESQNVQIAGGIDSSGNAMIVRSANSGIIWNDVTPSSPPSTWVSDVIWDEYRQHFWAILNNGDIWYSDADGSNWTKLSGGTFSAFSRIAVDPYSGVLVFSNSGSANHRICVSIDGHYADEIGIGEEIHWIDPGVVKWAHGRFLIGAGNDLFIGGTMRGGDRQYLYMG